MDAKFRYVSAFCSLVFANLLINNATHNERLVPRSVWTLCPLRARLFGLRELDALVSFEGKCIAVSSSLAAILEGWNSISHDIFQGFCKTIAGHRSGQDVLVIAAQVSSIILVSDFLKIGPPPAWPSVKSAQSARGWPFLFVSFIRYF